jgi:single-stranded-DNA-specific exonuclease
VRWVLPETIDEQAASLAGELGIHPLPARVLLHRGYRTPEAASTFLSDKLADLPDPFRMKGMAAATERLTRALRLGEKITLYGDYDVDGVCSTSLLALFLRELGAQPGTYIPHRIGEGYGLNLQAVERLAAEGTRVLVTLDCGISATVEISRARDLGVDVVIVDHHTVPETLPPAVAVLNPHQPGCDYPTKTLCAAGVAFNLCMGLRKRLRDDGFFATRKEPNLRALMDLVAMATVADVVPLTGANRILVAHGLQELTTARRPGVRALKEAAGMEVDVPVTAGQIGFRLGPRINAAGRLHDASLGLQLLTAESLEEARRLAQVLDRANQERQGIESTILTEALKQAEPRKDSSRGFVLYSEGWHPGVVGIVASRVVERFHRPTIVIGVKDGVGKGSARSIEAFHLYDAISGCADMLMRFGGHKYAAGLTIEADRLPAFRDAFERIATERLTPEDLIPRCKVDAVVTPRELDERAVQSLQRLGPFGQGNPEPVLVLRRQLARPRVLPPKTGYGSAHLKLALVDAPEVDAIGFGMADRLSLIEGPVDLAFQVGVDTFRGQRRVSLRLKDLRTAA